uniref:Uncharacterized protein n=1 Tax=Oryza rufipogon TaxID=4529 RepID=A0A0E0R2D2_ORYRU
MASLMVGIGNGTTSTPMFVLQLLLWGPKPARLLWVPSSQSNVGLLRGLQYRDRCACSRPLAKKYTLELLFASSPPSVTAAAMKECVLDEYSTKHRISIDRFLQLKIFVKIAILDSVNMGGGRDILRKERSSKAWLKNSIHPWYLRYIMFQPLKESCIHSGDSNFLDLEWLST